jgi:hypothetical protein
MAEDGAASCSEDGGHPSRLLGQDAVPDGVHASMHEVQPAAFEPVVDRAPTEPQAGDLRAGDHAVLAVRERRDQGVERTSATLIIYFMVKCTLVSHRAMVAARVCRRTP